MQSTSLAPELSATFRRLSCWIMCLLVRPLSGPFEDLDDAPALLAREGTGLRDPDPIALAGVVGLVVGVELAGLLHRLAVAPVLHAVHDRDHRGFVHLRGDHDALAYLAAVRPRLGGCRLA